MDQRLKKLVINSDSIPKTMKSYIPQSLCLQNISLFKEYAKCNKLRELLQLTRRYSRFSEFLLPQTTRRIIPYSRIIKKKPGRLNLKDVSIRENNNNEKNRLWRQMINSHGAHELSDSITNLSPKRLYSSVHPRQLFKNTAIRIKTSKPHTMLNKIVLKPKSPKKRNELLRFQCLFKNDLIKSQFKNNDRANNNNSNKSNISRNIENNWNDCIPNDDDYDDDNYNSKENNKEVYDHIMKKEQFKRRIKVSIFNV